MPEPRLEYVMCASPAGTHRMAYWEWGDPGNRDVLLCVHGLTRTGRDFDEIAKRLQNRFRVVCPDVVGRGKSDWLVNPAGYAVPQYVADMLTLIARLNPVRLDWLGTSMGGLIALGLAGALAMSAVQRPDRGAFGLPPQQTIRLNKLVLNDVGPQLNIAGLSRIVEYVGKSPQFDSFAQAVDYVRSVSEGFGRHSPGQWEQLTRHVFNRQGDHWIKHYDVRMAEPMALQNEASVTAAELVLWAAYQSIDAPILLIRGQQSDLLSLAAAAEMLTRNPHASMVEFPDVGHAPTLLVDEQIEPIRQFLLAA